MKGKMWVTKQQNKAKVFPLLPINCFRLRWPKTSRQNVFVFALYFVIDLLFPTENDVFPSPQPRLVDVSFHSCFPRLFLPSSSPSCKMKKSLVPMKATRGILTSLALYSKINLIASQFFIVKIEFGERACSEGMANMLPNLMRSRNKLEKTKRDLKAKLMIMLASKPI